MVQPRTEASCAVSLDGRGRACSTRSRSEVVPVLLGAGAPLSGEGTPAARLVLQRSQALPAGLVQLTSGSR